MFSFKMSRIFKKLTEDRAVGYDCAVHIVEKLSLVYDAAQYTLRDPTDLVRFEQIHCILESYDEVVFAINGLIPTHLKPEWHKYTNQLGDLVTLALITHREWKNIQDDLHVRMVYNFFLGNRTKKLFIESSITFLRYMDIQFSCIEGYPMTAEHVHKTFCDLMLRIGSDPIQRYREIYENYFYHEYLMTNRRLADLLPYAQTINSQ